MHKYNTRQPGQVHVPIRFKVLTSVHGLTLNYDKVFIPHEVLPQAVIVELLVLRPSKVN